MQGSWTRPFWLLVAITLSASGLAVVVSPDGSEQAVAQTSETSTIPDAMLGIETGVATSATTELFGWTAAALGLNTTSNGDLEIEDELAEINAELVDIDTELSDIYGELELETCELDADETTSTPTTQIAYWNSQLEQMQSAGTTQSQIETFVDGVLGSDTDSIPYQLIALNQALLDSGSIPGVISACLAVLDTPVDGTGGDTEYYEQVSNLLTYFYGYQVEGLNLTVEAYHAQAAEAYIEANPTAVITNDTLNSICTDAVANTSVAVYCNDAVYWVSLVYQNLQEQFALAGAPYSVDGEALTVNGTSYVFAQSLEAFSAAQGSSCASPLESSDPCGPLAGTNATASIAPSSDFAWRTDWSIATAEQWRAAVDWWTDDSQTLGDYLDDFGFDNTTNSTKVIVTNTTYTAEPEAVIDGEEKSIFSSPAVCFLDTAIERTHAHQPWCYNGSNDGVDYGEASDLLEDVSGDDCAHFSATSTYTDAGTNDFFQGTYEVGNTCDDVGWIDGIQPGWLLDSDGESATQYLWPVFDMSAATCNTNVNGSARSTTNTQGVYTMCGDDFDAWFAEIVPTPEVTDTSPAASATSTSAGSTTTVTTGAWDSDSDVTVTANSEPLVLDRTKTDFSGSLHKSYLLPADFPLGAHTVTITGVSDGTPFTISVPFTVYQLRFTG